MKMFRVVVNGNEYKVGIEELPEEGGSQGAVKSSPAPPTPAKPVPPSSQPKPAAPKASPAKIDPAATNGTITAPMPGTVLNVAVAIGDSVTQGQTLLVLEAMKMENEIMAPMDGVVQELNISQGVSVNAGDILVVLSS